MSKLMVKVKKVHEDAQIPTKSHPEDACWDLYSIDNGTKDDDGFFIEYRTGIHIELPEDYHAEIRPRSSISKYDLILCNSPGTIDNNYRGEIKVRFKQTGTFEDQKNYMKGERIAQMNLFKSPDFVFVEANELSPTVRGEGGFGSTNK